jgi:hypothetical protein
VNAKRQRFAAPMIHEIGPAGEVTRAPNSTFVDVRPPRADWHEAQRITAHGSGFPNGQTHSGLARLVHRASNLFVTDPQLCRDRGQRRVSRPQVESSDECRRQEMHVDPPYASAV